MPNWKKIITSGSDAALTSLSVTNAVTATSFTGSLLGTASFAVSASRAVTASFALTAGTLVGSVSTASYVVNTVAGASSTDLVYGNMADNDQFRIRIGGTATNAGFVEIATADDGTEPIHVRQYTGVFATLTRTATLLDGSGNTIFPGSVTANGTLLTGNTGTVTSVATAGTVSGITLTGGTITSTGTITLGGSISGLTNSNLSGTAGITNANLANSSVTVGSTAISLGSSATTIAGLTSVTSTTFVGALTGNAATATNATLAQSATTATSASFASTASYISPTFISASAAASGFGSGGGGGSGTVNSGAAGKLAYYPTTATTVDDTNLMVWDNSNTRLGIGVNATSPANALNVSISDVSLYAARITNGGGGSSGAIFAEGLSGCVASNGIVQISSLGAANSAVNLVLTSSAASNQTMFKAIHGSTTVFSISGSRVGVNTATPINATLDVNGSVYATSFTGSIQGTATTASYISPTFISASAAASGFGSGGGGGSGTVNSGAAGYVAYYPSATTTVDDTSQLYWDNANSRLGIKRGTSPAFTLDVSQSIAVNGFKGIYAISNDNMYANIRVMGNESTVNQDGMYIGYTSTGTTNGHTRIYAATTTPRIFINALSGNTSIGATASVTPSYALDVVGDIYASANIIAYSDESVKDNVTTIPNALDKIKSMRGVTFTRNDQEDKERIHAGVIAQEIEKAFPEVVFENPDGTKAVAYGNIVSVLIEAIKEQQKQIDDLKQQIEELP